MQNKLAVPNATLKQTLNNKHANSGLISPSSPGSQILLAESHARMKGLLAVVRDKNHEMQFLVAVSWQRTWSEQQNVSLEQCRTHDITCVF
jgi:hypothetical protein